MNSTVNNSHNRMSGGTNVGRKAITDVSYSVGFSVAILFVLVIISYISYRCNRNISSISNRNNNLSTTTTMTDDVSVTFPRGLTEATLITCPTFLYSQAKNHKGADSVAGGCSICLVDYRDTDMLRVLPECGHLFHLKCIDPWLKLHPSCPICRCSPVPNHPVVEVLPLPTQ